MQKIHLLMLLVFSYTLVAQEKEHPVVEPLPIGSTLPYFSLKGTDEKIYSPDDFKEDKLLVVIFTCNHCPTAQAYEQRIKDLYNIYHPEGVGFVAISPNSNTALSLAECGYSDLDDSFESMKIRANDIGLPFPYLYDGETSETSIKFGPVATPHVFIFDKDRKLRYRGRIDDMESPYEAPSSRDANDAIAALLANRPVKVQTTKTFGCSVKWPWKDEWTKELIKRWDQEPVSLEPVESDELKKIMENTTDGLILLNVWATYCGPCVMEFPDLVDTYRMYQGRGLTFYSLSLDKQGSKDKALAFLEKKNAAGKNYIWADKSAYDAIDIVGNNWQGSLPFTLVIKPGGEVIFSYEGAVNILTLRKAIIDELGRYFADDN